MELWLLNSYAEDIVRTIREPLLVLDGELCVEAANQSFYRDFKVTPEQTLGLPIHELGDGQWDDSALRKRLDKVFLTDSDFSDYAIEHDFPGVGPRTMLLNARRLHGGGIESGLDSHPFCVEGRGATFTVNLPLHPILTGEGEDPMATDPADTSKPELMPVRLNGLRVLVVDDEADARRLLVKSLGDAGAIVTAVGSVTEALAGLTIANPQVLISDLAMPERDGYELIRQVRGMGLTAKELPAVALTAFAGKEDRRRALLAGFQVHLPKPIDTHDLAAVIAALAGRTD
jgi:CheY-like chemotaxis protein